MNDKFVYPITEEEIGDPQSKKNNTQKIDEFVTIINNFVGIDKAIIYEGIKLHGMKMIVSDPSLLNISSDQRIKLMELFKVVDMVEVEYETK